ALGLPRPWDQQWSLRIQQILAFESDLLEYDDIFEGSKVIEAKTAELIETAGAELADVDALGGAFEAIDELKLRLVRSQAERVRRIETGEQRVVGVNSFTESAPSPRPGGTRSWCAGPSTSCAGWPRTTGRRPTSWPPPSPWPTPAGRPASGPAPCGRCSASFGPRPA